MRNFLNSVELSDLIEGVNTGRETSVKTENLTLNDCSQRKIIEKFCELFPDIGVSVLSQAFIIETIAILES